MYCVFQLYFRVIIDILKDLPGDRLVGPYITINPELCMVIENSDYKIIGYACAALDAKVFFRNQEVILFALTNHLKKQAFISVIIFFRCVGCQLCV